MDAQSIYRTFLPYALDVASERGVAIEDALLLLARAASACPANLPRFEIAQYVHADRDRPRVRERAPRDRLNRAATQPAARRPLADVRLRVGEFGAEVSSVPTCGAATISSIPTCC